MFKQITLAAAAISSVAMLPAAAEAGNRDRGYSNSHYSQQYRGDRRYRQDRRYQDRRYYGRNYRRSCKSGTTGAIVGGAGGALLGREIAGRRGSRTTGTILGAAIGALAGREITRTC